jgi:hypothetical protein
MCKFIGQLEHAMLYCSVKTNNTKIWTKIQNKIDNANDFKKLYNNKNDYLKKVTESYHLY